MLLQAAYIHFAMTSIAECIYAYKSYSFLIWPSVISQVAHIHFAASSIAGYSCNKSNSFFTKSSMLSHAKSIHSEVKLIAEGTHYKD
jgi:hypothetical protein